MENGVQRTSQRTKESLKSKLDGNQLDLSLSSLDAVPVKELAALPKATCLDLSCNRLVTLGNEFSLLTHLVKLDLSKNHLTCLPDSFGSLQKLQHLDLYNNRLVQLPLTFCKLNNLKWMDVRDNPLESDLLEQAGDCLNETQCRACAKQVVAYMKKCQSDDERLRQKRLQEERMRESARKLEEELERQRVQLAKKVLKEQRRKEMASQRQVRHTDEDEGLEDEVTGSTESGVTVKGKGDLKKMKPQKVCVGGMSCCGFLFSMLFFLIVSLSFIVVGLSLFCSSEENVKSELCHERRHYAEMSHRLALDSWATVKDWYEEVKVKITASLS